MTIPNVLANRYASDDMVAIWSPEAKIVAERRLWIAVLRAQAELGVAVPDGVIADYERVLEQVDLASIFAREARDWSALNSNVGTRPVVLSSG